ncbi:MAG: hypothetical protein JSS82_08300 [Bacteroidetes bacterium]|nr:hypothetical protein [Bacteroidota bacterium]
MSIIITFEYKHIFDEERSDAESLLKKIPSKFVIGILATISDTLIIKGTSASTQEFLFRTLTVNFPDDVKEKISARVLPLLSKGYELFVVPTIVEFLNREIINFRSGFEPSDNYGEDELNIFKAFIAIGDEIIERDLETQKKAIDEAKLGGENLIKLMWPHLIRQFEFTSHVDPIFEAHKGMAFMAFIEEHHKFGPLVKKYFSSLGCNSGQEYLHRILSIAIPHLKREKSENPMDYFFRIKVETPEPVLEALVIDPVAVQLNPDKQYDYLGLKEKPIFKFQRNEYIVPYWDFLYNALFTGLLFSLYNNSEIRNFYNKEKKQSEDGNEGLANFKGVIGKEFSEKVLFQKTIDKCFSHKHDSLCFFDDDESFNPDCYYRHNNHIFIFEFKDYLLNSEVIQSASYERIRAAIDEKFVSVEVEIKGKTKVKEKGVYQIARNVELLARQDELFYRIDEKAKRSKLKLRNMIIHPIIVQTSIYFDFPGINEYLNDKIQERLHTVNSVFRNVAQFTMIHFNYFIDRLLLFSDSKIELHEELEYYRDVITKQKKRAIRTLEVDDWFQSMVPFNFVNSPTFRKFFLYRRKEILPELFKIWNIDKS